MKIALLTGATAPALMGFALVDVPASADTTIVAEAMMTEMSPVAPMHELIDEADVEPPVDIRTAPVEASYYGKGFTGRTTANGETFDPSMMTAAHKSLPFGSMVKVTDPSSGKSVTVRINDRGPYHGNRAIDLSEGAAKALGIIGRGTAKVHLDVLS